jgi:CoA:oxalate CoA-transferase
VDEDISDEKKDFDREGIKRGRRLNLLDGLKVIDLTRFLAGPFGSMVLADMGADVLKVEQLTGDSTRDNPPYYFQGDSAYFIAINRNKRSISLDIRSVEGKEILRKLIADADIVLDNLRVPQREALGLSFGDLKKINPRIVSVSVTGFGSDGPYEDRPAYDIIVEALGGIMALTGPIGGPSVRAGVPIGDIVAGLYLAIGSLAGITSRNATGIGMHVDVGMLDAQVSLLSYLAQYYLTGGLIPTHQGREHVSIPTYNTFATKDDSEIVIAAMTDEMWVSLCSVLGRDDLPKEADFETKANRLRNREGLLAVLRGEILEWDSQELFEALIAVEVPVAPIYKMDQALSSPQVRHREMVVSVPHRKGGEFLTLGVPVKTEDLQGGEFQSPPGLGEHSTDVLRSLGYSDDQIDALASSGIVRI